MIFFILVSIFVSESASGKLTTLIELYFCFEHQNNISKLNTTISSILIYDSHSNIPDFDIKVYSVNKTESFIRTNLNMEYIKLFFNLIIFSFFNSSIIQMNSKVNNYDCYLSSPFQIH